jgi:predicted deacylase
MRPTKLTFAALLVVACAPSAHRSTNRLAWTPQCCGAEGKLIAEKHGVSAITSRRFTHAELWGALNPLVQASGLTVADVGRSIQGRPIRAVTFGTGAVTVLLWSQMHGDESTATMSLADLISWFASAAPEHAALRNSLGSKLRIVMIPMLNPDGAELFQRENAIGVDVNRDARNLSTPEARALKSLRDSIQPAFGFNLHDQNARTLTGDSGNQVAIALLAPAADEDRTYGAARSTARLVAAVIASVLKAEIPGRLAKYNDAHEPRAFGDLMQRWGTSTVLIESGAMPEDPEKQKLREVNVIAILSALNAMADGSWRKADPQSYESIPTNSRSAVDLLVRGASLVLPGAEPIRADVALNYEEPVARREPRVREVGDLARVIALDTFDVSGMYLHPAASMLTDRNGMRWIRFDTTAVIAIRRGRDPSSEIVRRIPW